jgi:hypothetical protein
MMSSRLTCERLVDRYRGLAYLQADVSADRVRLLATLGLANGGAGAYEPADEALRDALNIASRLSDPKLEASALGARSRQ